MAAFGGTPPFCGFCGNPAPRHLFLQPGRWKRMEQRSKPENEWGRVECEPIVSEDLWNQANQILEEQTKSFKKPGKAPVHLVQRLGPHCFVRPQNVYEIQQSEILFAGVAVIRYRLWTWKASLDRNLKPFLASPGGFPATCRKPTRNLAEKSALLDAHQHEIQKVRDEMKRTHRLFIQEQITPARLWRLLQIRRGAIRTSLWPDCPNLRPRIGFP